ncbi:hypothetical protein F4679DRAFT_559548 [Xylaria curta]|nr:hypothetical protein F4679DRAFT_559548 [Xylaria curta]
MQKARWLLLIWYMIGRFAIEEFVRIRKFPRKHRFLCDEPNPYTANPVSSPAPSSDKIEVLLLQHTLPLQCDILIR